MPKDYADGLEEYQRFTEQGVGAVYVPSGRDVWVGARRDAKLL